MSRQIWAMMNILKINSQYHNQKQLCHQQQKQGEMAKWGRLECCAFEYQLTAHLNGTMHRPNVGRNKQNVVSTAQHNIGRPLMANPYSQSMRLIQIRLLKLLTGMIWIYRLFIVRWFIYFMAGMQNGLVLSVFRKRVKQGKFLFTWGERALVARKIVEGLIQYSFREVLELLY